MTRILTVLTLALISITTNAQLLTPEKPNYTHADSLRGSITPERAWWNLIKYELSVTPDFNNKSLSGENAITFQATSDGQTMQIDLQEPLAIKTVTWNKKSLAFSRDGNAFLIKFPKPIKANTTETIRITYSGTPKVAVRPPWGGGWIWNKDAQGRPWMTVACEGLGASSWFPCKDHLSDEPDSGVVMHVTAADTLTAIANGRLKDKKSNNNGTTTWTWVVTNPINSYDIIPYIGKYVNWTSTFNGEKGKLDCSYWVLDYNLEKA
ncbi:MAG: M1 family peptidase, partial [Bacteroidetes bacterium]|nr:M1 family peptidase [Bacteroidota bacterium]